MGRRWVWQEKVDNERLMQAVGYSFIREQVPRVKQIARMLAVECSNNLACVKVREADDRHFREPEFRVHAQRYRPDGRLVDTALQYRRDFGQESVSPPHVSQ